MTPTEIYKLQVWLKATKRCAGCREVKLVAEFAGYSVSICNACDAVPTPVVEPESEDRYDACPGCGRGKFAWLPICRPCKSKQLVEAGAA